MDGNAALDRIFTPKTDSVTEFSKNYPTSAALIGDIMYLTEKGKYLRAAQAAAYLLKEICKYAGTSAQTTLRSVK
jgi:hypothetical protein